MDSFIYPTDTQIIEPLAKNIAYFQQSGTSGLRPVAPTSEEMKELLNCSFAASLQTEESRSVAFTVSFFAKKDQEFPYQFNQPFAVSSRDLARLAVALDPSRTRICVSSRDGSLKVFGLYHLGDQDAFHGGRQTLFEFSVRVLGPGIMVVRYADIILLTYRNGKFAFHAGDLSEYRRGTILDDNAVGYALSFGAFYRGSGGLNRSLRLDATLMRIARSMLRHRHGGTLLILPESADWEERATSGRFAPTAPISTVRNANIQDLMHTESRKRAFQKVIEGRGGPEVAPYWVDDMTRSQFAVELEWLGRLTATDGMTLIRPDLALLGFGVFFDTYEDNQSRTRVMVFDPFDDNVKNEQKDLSSIGGARHQSAAVICRTFPGTVAIVTSQDGSLTSMRRHERDDYVIVYRNMELLLDA